MLLFLSLSLSACGGRKVDPDEYITQEVTKAPSISIGPEQKEEHRPTATDYFKVPYVSTYYFNPKPSIYDTIQIPIYLTDSEQSEYLLNDTEAVLDLIWKLDGEVRTETDVPLGDYTLTIGRLEEGMHSLSLQVLDKRTGMRSHELFNELWVIDPAKYEITEAQTYYMTEADLSSYRISNQNSMDAEDCINTRDGLNRLFAEKQGEGYRKIVLLPGTYRINGEKTDAAYDSKQVFYISIPTRFTVDMNGSTFKLDTITSKHHGCIVKTDDAFDSHLINGTLEGDRLERIELGLESAEANRDCLGEPINTLLIQGGRYCSASNLTVKNTTGHAVGSGGIFGPEYTLISEVTKTAIFGGEEIESDVCSTSAMIDLQKIMAWKEFDGYVFVAHLLGYKGIQGDSPIEYISFYDENQRYIETIVGYQYRKIKVPEGATYLRATFLGDIETKGYEHTITVYTEHLGDYTAYQDIDFYDTRTTALVASCGSNILIENCTFTRCGSSITPVAVDFEEGGEECQDLYYRNNHVLENAETTTGTVVDCAGYNHVYENNTGHLIEIRNRVSGGVIRNTDDEDSDFIWFLGTKKTGSYGRIYRNNCGYIHFSDESLSKELRDTAVDFKVRDCTIHCGGYGEGIYAVADKVTFENCVFPNLFGEKASFRSCTIQPAGELGEGLRFYDCTFKRLTGDGTKLEFELPYLADRVFERCRFEGRTILGSRAYRLGFRLGTFRNCDFDDLQIYLRAEENSAPTVFENCTIREASRDLVYVGALADDTGPVNLQFKNCEITQNGDANLIYIYAKPNGGSILFEDCRVTKDKGQLLGLDDEERIKDNVSTEIIFNNTSIDAAMLKEANRRGMGAVRFSSLFSQ